MNGKEEGIGEEEAEHTVFKRESFHTSYYSSYKVTTVPHPTTRHLQLHTVRKGSLLIR